MALKVVITNVLLMVTILVTIVQSGDSYDKSIREESNEQLKVADDDLAFAESVRNVRLIDDSEHWHTIQRFQTEDERPLETRPQKRRRLRKRKRRPQHIQQQFGDEQGEIIRPRRRRPIRLDEVDDGWKEMEAESPHRPYSRRRVGPIYQEDSTLRFADSLETFPDKSFTKNEDVAPTRNVITSTTTEHTTSLKDIKDILKQTGGLSLSEILLQKNLTLNDLLQGNQNAILALSERPLQAVTEKQHFAETQNAELMRNNDLRRKFSQSYGQENKVYSEITSKYEVITEATTEKRIFVPSHPKYYTSVNYKPEFDLVTDAPKRTTPKLPMTSAQMQMILKKTEVKTPDKPLQIPLSDMFGFDVINDAASKGPFKMSFDLEEFAKLNTVVPENKNLGEISKLEQSTQMKVVETTTEEIMSTTPMLTPGPITILTPTTPPTEFETTLRVDTPTSEKLITTQRFINKFTTIKPTIVTTLQPKKVSISAKEEIMEIMSNSDEKHELSKLLTSKNMTVEQLVEQRERGSSQRHLAEIFHNKTKEPEPTQIVEQVKGLGLKPHPPAQETFINNMNNRKPKQITTTSTTTTTRSVETTPTFTNPAKPLEDVSMSSEEITVAERLPSTSFPTYKIETNKISKEIPPLHIPIWKTIYPSIYIESERNEKNLELDAIEQSIRQAVDDNLNEISRSNNNLNEYDDYIQLPLGVKSAIFASLAIIGMSLVLFLTILVVFRWSQKHKKRLCYGGSGNGFTCSKIKSPILQHEPKRTIRTFVSETLGKRRNFYAQHFRQSMSDSWESNERPYQ